MVERNNLPRSLSLKSRVDIDRLFKSGRKLSGDYFTLLWENSDRFQYGIFVGKQIGQATVRNRVKRLTREAIRFNRNVLKKPVKIAVLPRKKVQEIGFDRLNAEIGRIFGSLT